MLKKFRLKNFGFTLIELMTSMAIIAVLSVLAAANYHRGNRQVILNNQAAQFASDIRRVQEWALSSRQINGVTSYGYGIYIAKGADSYILYSDNDNNQRYTPGEELETVALNNDIEIPTCKPDDLSINYVAPDLTAAICRAGAPSCNYDWAKIQFQIKNDASMSSYACANAVSLVFVSDSGDECQ